MIKMFWKRYKNGFLAGRRFVSVSLFVLVISALSISAKSFSEYKGNISFVKEEFSKIIIDGANSRQSKDSMPTIFAKIPELLPAEDTVEFAGASISVDNKWLAAKIAEYEMKSANSVERKIILTEIFERLEAIELKLDEMEGILFTNNKDTNKQKIRQVLSREEYGKPQNKESFIGGLIRRIMNWISSILPSPRLPSNQASGFQSLYYFLQIFVYILVLAVVGFIVYKFAPFFLQRIKSPRKRRRRSRIILGEELAADETSKNLFAEAEKLAGEGDLKAAIRKGYISLLFELSERKLIGLAKHKTNRDYLRDVRKRRELFREMNGLTLNYERHWYGFDSADEKDWEEFKNGYRNTTGKNRDWKP